ncbi:glutathione-dependent formaldehyde-activating enzyme [Aspergillus udagawae]|uniref:Glutathione-dependent formaldehyde-activating enzyme n=1 Tax=Aspergillus udagawae TaxID=91492 RepID=A0ABQ1BA62_9EURO|nr:glutathione-dependent formaldehyde-activating enzyme [Aspergillus udagawae]GFF97208.1 glutathione-dependent formaldehyde-activating enzyme [Aspergillus udagawae]GFG16128.1 glutathione-dependent formaldehyde-activating enzyme [Aspergillus udagawae]
MATPTPTTATGGCFCGKVRIEYSGEPMTVGLCHCSDCRKITGSLYSYNFVVKRADLKITGSPKELAKIADSGTHIKNYFCADCGTPLYGLRMNSDGVPAETTVLRAGIFDDIEVLNQRRPEAEIFTSGRVSWMSPIEGTGQFVGMVPLP